MTNIGEYLPTSSTLAVFHLNGNSINTVGSKTSTDTNITYVDGGKFGQCASFNGIDSLITFTNIGTLTTFTISLWINTTSNIVTTALSQSNQYNNGYFFALNENGYVVFQIWNGGSSTNLLSSKPINDGNWHNIIVTRNGATAKVYIDGQYDNQRTDMYTVTIGNYYRSIGKKLSNLEYFDAKLDEIIIENRVWSETEIKNYYDITNNTKSLGEFLPTTNTLNYFKFNGNSNNSIGNVASTDSNIAYTNGKFGKCAYFNGTSSKILYTGTQLTNFTISLWIKAATSSSQYYIISQATSGYPYRNLDVAINDNKFVLDFYDGNSLKFTSNSSIRDNKWHNIVSVRNGSTAYIYIDGSLDKSGTVPTFIISNDVNVIGCHSAGLSFYNGQMDEIIIENKVWTANEVRKYYTNSIGRFAIL